MLEQVAHDVSSPFNWSGQNPWTIDALAEAIAVICEEAAASVEIKDLPVVRSSGLHLPDKRADCLRMLWQPELRRIMSLQGTSSEEGALSLRRELVKFYLKTVTTNGICDLGGFSSIFEGSNETVFVFGIPVKLSELLGVFVSNGKVSWVRTHDGIYHSPITVAGIRVIASDTPAEVLASMEHLSGINLLCAEPSEVKKVTNAIKSTNGEYQNWIFSVIHDLVICPSIEPDSRSGSWNLSPGTVYMSSMSKPMNIMDVMVHEACHQHFYIGELFSDISTSQEEKYFSVAVNRKRPLRAVLLAYHAFVNVCVYYKLNANDNSHLIDGYFKRAIQRTIGLRDTLDAATEFTEFGASLFDALRQMVSKFEIYDGCK